MAATTGNGKGKSNSQELVTRLVSALEGMGGGQPGPTPSQATIIEQHAELKRALAGPRLARVSPGPSISKVVPVTGAAGTAVTIDGEQLEATTLVHIGAGRVRKLDTRSDTKLVLTIPNDATTGPITVFTLLGMAAGGDFKVT